MASLTVVTINLRGVHDRWWKREPLLVRGLARLSPDVICAQEAATWCFQAHWLAWRLRRTTRRPYRAFHTPKRGRRGLFEGIATLSAVPVAGRASTALGGDGRVAQAVTVVIDGTSLRVVNTHLDHLSHRSELRVAQARRVLDWAYRGKVPALLAGDMNAVPGSEPVAAFSARLRSAHERPGLELAGTSPAWDARNIIDYVFLGEGLELLDSGVCLDAPVDGVWPSDHVGFWARVAF